MGHKLSLLTICLNSEDTILDTIESVLSQSFKNIEYIVYDGGSSDSTLSIIRKFGNKLKLVEGRDTGIYAAFNSGLKYTTGDIVGILNSDDFLANKDVLRRVIECFESNNVDTVYSNLEYVNRKDVKRVQRIWKSGKLSKSKFRLGWSLPHPTLYVKRDIYESLGWYDERFMLAGDYELMLRLFYVNKVSSYYLQETTVKMRTGGAAGKGLASRIVGLMEIRKAWLINGYRPWLLTIMMKPLRKLHQWVLPKLM